MHGRLVERYAVGDAVDVRFGSREGDVWVAARVVGHAHPGVWVEVEGPGSAGPGSGGRDRWFVTNSGRIRGRPARGAPRD